MRWIVFFSFFCSIVVVVLVRILDIVVVLVPPVAVRCWWACTCGGKASRK